VFHVRHQYHHLLAGMAVYIKAVLPNVRVIGVEC
jgi:threonine dehydratase